MAITKIQAGALPADVITTAAIDDASITHAKLHTTMDLSSKTVTLPTLSSLNTTGNVGIGTSSPSTQLEVKGSTYSLIRVNGGNTNNAGIDFGDTDDVDIGRIRYDNSSDAMQFWTNNAERMRITSAGDILGKTADVRIGSDVGAVEYGTSTDNSVRFYSNDTERMRINSSGHVGIGTSSPNQWASYTDSAATVLQVRDTSQRARIVINGGNGAHLDLVDYAGGANDKHMNIAVDSGILKFGSLNDAGNAWVKDDIMVMDLGTGNVGIGTTSPDAIFTVDTNVAVASTGTIARFHSSKGANDSTFLQIAATRHPTASVQRVQLQAFDDDGSTGRTLALNSSGGNVGIGTNSPNATLTVSQSANNIFSVERTGVSSGSGQFGINVEANSQVTVSYDDGAPLVFGTASSPSTHTGFTERARIDSGGYVSMHYQPHACWRSQNSTNGNYRLPKSHQHLNTGNNLSSTGRYTCPVAGTYHFSASGFTNYNSSYGYLHLKLNGNSKHDVHWNHGPMGTGHTAISGQITLYLSSGDYLETWQNTGSGAWIQDCIGSVIFLG